MLTALTLALLLGDTLRPGVAVKDEGTAKGQATTVNCTGTGVTCSVGAGGVWTIDSSGGAGATTPGGSDTQVQYNNAGTMAGASGVLYNNLTSTLTVGTVVSNVAANQAALAIATNARLYLDGSGGSRYLSWNGSTIGATGAFSVGTLALNAGSLYPGATSALGIRGRVTSGVGLKFGNVSALTAGDSLACWYNDTTLTTPLSCIDTTGSFSGNAATSTALAANGGNCSAGQAAQGVDAAGAAEGCFTPPGTYSLPDATSGVTGGVRLTGDLGGTATSPTVTGVTGAVVGVSNLNATGTPSATTYLRGDGTWSTPAGGGGSPGGSTTQVQYNNAGAFGGAANVIIDAGDLAIKGSTADPATPPATYTKLFGAQPHGSNGPILPFWKGASTQIDYRLFPEMRSADPVWGCLQPGAHGSTTITPAGSIIAGGATGTPAAVAWAATDERTRAKWVQYPSATTASSSAGLRAGVDYMWRGNAAGIGGFYVWGSFNVVTTTANQRLFVGIKDATAVIGTTANPSASLDTAYFGCDAAQTTIRICSNDNAGAATCTDLGANFPCTTANIAYDWALWAQPNGSSIGYYIRRLVGGQEAQGTISSDLPRNTVALGWDYWINNGGTAAASTMQFGGVCYIANP